MTGYLHLPSLIPRYMVSKIPRILPKSAHLNQVVET